MTLALVYIFVLALVPAVAGVPYVARHEIARRRARWTDLPPMKTIATTIDDTIPF